MKMGLGKPLAGVRARGDLQDVYLMRDEFSGRLCFVAENQGGYDSVWIDALD